MRRGIVEVRFWVCLGLCLVLAMIALVAQLDRQRASEAPARSSMGEAVDDPSDSRPVYRIEADYDEKSSTVSGRMEVTLPKNRSESWKEVYFHLYPNAFRRWQWGEESKPKESGYLDVSEVRVNGRKAQSHIDGTVMKLSLPEPLPPGQSAQIEMIYRLKLPKGGNRLNAFGKTAFLAQWYPMLAVKDQDGWHTEPYTAVGDPFYSQMSDFEVTFRVPEGYRLITSADDRTKPVKGDVTLRQENIRDFAAVITKDYDVIEGAAGNVQVNLWYQKGMEKEAKELHRAAVSGMQFFGSLFGAYPYREVDVVLGETGHGIAGMEYPGLVTSIPKYPTRDGERPAVNVVVHELAHQWWYGVVGNNQVKEPWLDEGLTTFSELLYMHDKMGEDQRELLGRVAEVSDEIHDKQGVTSVEPLYKYSDSIYGLMVYTRPAAMLWELMDVIGRDKVLEILRTYYDRYKFQVATTADFIKVANEVAGKDLTPFFDRWLYFKEHIKKAG
jgi:Peptidase family M1 domain